MTAIPDRKREHPSELLDTPVAEILVEMDDALGVGVRPKAMAGGFEPRPQLPEVVQLAVVDDPNRLVLVRDRLLAGVKIDDRQPPHSESDTTIDEVTVIVGSSVTDDIAHRAEPIWICTLFAYESRDSAHQRRVNPRGTLDATPERTGIGNRRRVCQRAAGPQPIDLLALPHCP